MSAVEPLCHLLGINPAQLTRDENLILEAELFKRICDELRRVYLSSHLDFLRKMKCHSEREFVMVESLFIREVINDILLSQEYSLEGIAVYTDTPPDVICDIMSGQNSSPTFQLSRKIINLHRTVRPAMYREIITKITADMACHEVK